MTQDEAIIEIPSESRPQLPEDEVQIDDSRRAILRRLGPAGLLGILWVSLPGIFGIVLLTKIGLVSDWLNGHGEAGVFVYTLAFIISAGFGFLPTYSQAILGGWVFGFVVGFPAALAGFAGASVIGYFITRFVSNDRVEREIAAHAKARIVRDALIGKGFWKTFGIVTLLRFPPNSPFALTNLAMASAGVSIVPFILGTAIGMAPRTAVAVFMAAQASATGSRDIQSFINEGRGIWVLLVGVIITIAILMVIGVIANKAVSHVLKTNE